MKRFAIIAVSAFAAISLLLSMGCSKGGGGDPLDDMIKHTKAMLKIITDNKADCAKVVTELEGYTKKHKAEFEAIAKKGAEMEKSMSEEDKKKFAEKAMKKMEGLIKESMTVIMEINQKCPEQAAKIGEAMRAIK